MAGPKRITDERLLAYAAGDLTGAAAEEAESFLGRTPAAARTVALYRLAAARVAADDSVDPPAETAERARRIFREGVVPEGASWPDRLATLVARLVFDSRLEAVPVRDSESGVRFQLGFATDDAEIDLQAERIVPRNGPGTSERWRLIGQYDADAGIPDLEVAIMPVGSDAPVVCTRTDEQGMFALEVAPGRYELRLAGPGAQVIVPGIDIG